MYQPNRSLIKRIAIDTVGVLLIIAAALTGWLPGPGGIPLLILGLSLLATNHEWAERLLMTIKEHGVKLADKLFDGHPATKLAVDAVAVLLIAGAVVLLRMVTGSTAIVSGISLVLLALFLLLSNRKRLHRLRRSLHKS